MSDDGLDGAFVKRWIGLLGERIDAAEQQLTELDAAIGDADHGANMTRGLTASRAALELAQPASPAIACQRVGEALVKSMGGASGPLYGSIFIALGNSLPRDAVIAPRDLVDGLRHSLTSLQAIGAAVVGDKTMLDALQPAVHALAEQLDAGASLAEASVAAAGAANAGAVSTIPLRARKGRASYLGPRSEGHQDPGATSSVLLFDALRDALWLDSRQC